MAWVCLDLNGMENNKLTTDGISLIANNKSASFLNRDWSTYVSESGNLNPQQYEVNAIMWSTSELQAIKRQSNYTLSWALYLNNVLYLDYINQNSNYYFVGIGFMVNDETQQSIVYTLYRRSIDTGNNDRTYFYKHNISDEYSYNLYLALKNVIPVLYNWQSVPSISGKNGILQSLVQIKEETINDGEPVSEATVLSFDSLGNINIPSVIDEQMPVDPSDVTSVTATYLIPALENGTYEGIKLLVKKGSIPTSEEDADKVVNLDEPTSILRIDSKSVGNLDEDSHYYFMVKLIDELGTEATSDPKDIWTSHSEGWSFDYTGSIQTFTAPKTGIYQLETWGAQGGNATDGTNSARGGYGAYAVGEVFLTQGDTLYINVGGQNGYGGGGNASYSVDAFNIFKGTDLSSAISCGEAIGTRFYQSNFNVANSSGQLLSNKIFYALGAQGINPTIDSQNKTITYPAASSGMRAYSVHLISVYRITGAKYIKCTVIRTENTSSSYRNAYFELSVYSVDNSQMVIGTSIDITNPTVNEEVEVTLDISQISYVDYIGFGVTKDPWIIKDILVVYE